MDTKTSTYNDEIDLIDIFKIIWRGKFLIIFFILIAILLGFSYIQVKNPVYQSKLNIKIEHVPPFYERSTGIITLDFKNYVLSKKNFNNWKSNLKKHSLAFNSFSKTIIIDGTELTNPDSLLVEMTQDAYKVSFIIKTNNLSILNDFYNYNQYINKLLEKEYVIRAKKELKFISSKIREFPMYAHSIIDKQLPNIRFITSIEMGKNVFNIQRPTVPKKVSPKSLSVYVFSSTLGGLIGLIIVFGRVFVIKNKNVVT